VVQRSKRVKKIRTIGLLSLFMVFFSPSAFSEPTDYTTFRRAELEKIAEDLSPHFKLLKEITQENRRGMSKEEVTEMVEALGRTPFKECASGLFALFKYQVLETSPANQNRELKSRITELLKAMISTADEDLLTDMKRTNSKVYEHKMYTKELVGFKKTNMNFIAGALKELKEKPESAPLPSLNTLIHMAEETRFEVIESLKDFSKKLSDRLIGQPEVVKAMEAQEWERHFIHHSNQMPSVIYLMGGPGTGKDTAAEALTDAIHSKDGAHKDHLFRLPIMRREADLWKVLGSATGYVGSETLPPFIEFLVKHSGGKYLIAGEGKTAHVIQNPEWKGESLPGTLPPESAVVFANEFHNWSKENKDVFLKEALEKGLFRINGPKEGLTYIEVPIRFVVASNEGIGLISSREANGERFGAPLTYEQSYSKWEAVSDNKSLLKSEIQAGNGAKNNGGVTQTEGVSEEFLRRIPNRFLILMKPLSPEELREIAGIALKSIKKDLEVATAINPGLKLSWDTQVLTVIQDYEYIPEDNAGPILDRVKSFINEPLISFLRSEKIKLDKPVQLRVSIDENEDGTKSLGIVALDLENNVIGNFKEPIAVTEKDRLADPISDERIDELLTLESRLNAQVFNVEDVAKRLSDRVLSAANKQDSSASNPQRATTVVLMGLSSTGKTELAKALSKELTQSESEGLVIDFSQVQTLHDFKVKILGIRDSLGNSTASDFMKHYDRTGGDLVVIFDELANVNNPDLLKALYDFFREPVVRTFSDGKDRVMSKVKVIVTGNSGIEEYASVPRTVPMEQQMAAWQKIHQGMVESPEAKREILEKRFPEPLINRWSLNNVFFVGPHTYKSLKQLAQLKFLKMIEDLQPKSGQRGWELGFYNPEEFSILMNTIVEKGFNLREQGSSIDLYISDDIRAPLEALLLRNKVPSGSRIMIHRMNETFFVSSEALKESWPLSLRNRVQEERLPVSEGMKDLQILTAYHEAGHAIASRVLFSGQRTPKEITILPGVTRIGGKWIVYKGVAEDEILAKSSPTREWFVRAIAQLAAGETAQRLVTRGEVHDAGKGNDMERATSLAESAILHYGLSEKWGTEAVPSEVSLHEYVSQFSEPKKRLFEKEVKKLINEGRALAREVLVLNMDQVLVPMAKLLAEKGSLKEADMAPFFEESVLRNVSETQHSSIAFELKTWARYLKSYLTGRSQKRDGIFKDPKYKSNIVADIGSITEKEKKDQFDSVPPPADAPSDENESSARDESCETLLQ